MLYTLLERSGARYFNGQRFESLTFVQSTEVRNPPDLLFIFLFFLSASHRSLIPVFEMFSATVAVLLGTVAAHVTAKPGPDPSTPQFMPNPSGHGFDDQGLTKDAEFQPASQMGRFGIPDLANPVTKELTDLDFNYAMEGDKYLAVMFYSYVCLSWSFFFLLIHNIKITY